MPKRAAWKFSVSRASRRTRCVRRCSTTRLQSNDFFAFTSTLNDRFSHEQKVRIIEFMWQVAYADGNVTADENHLISKVAGLLHVTHGEYIAAKMRAREGAG